VISGIEVFSSPLIKSLTVMSTNFALVKKKNVEKTERNKTINIFTSERSLAPLKGFQISGIGCFLLVYAE
jgi:hypothetical protein